MLANANAITVTEAGYYHATGCIRWNAAANGFRECLLYMNSNYVQSANVISLG